MPFRAAVVCAANSPESWATINQRGALGSLGARHLLTEIISAAPRTGPETQSGGHPLARSLARPLRMLCHAGGFANEKFYRPRTGELKREVISISFPRAKLRERGDARRAMPGARIINSAIPPRLFLLRFRRVRGSTTFYPLRATARITTRRAWDRIDLFVIGLHRMIRPHVFRACI